MAKLYYGSGECSIEGSEIRGVEIRYTGNITVELTADDSTFALQYDEDGIIIFPIGEGFLNDLFSYNGSFSINSVLVCNDHEIVPCTIHTIMDYSELLYSNAEDMTTKIEDLNAGHVSTKIITEYDGIMKNLHSNGEFYLEDGSIYSGSYHIHAKDLACMTGSEHTEKSQDLYYKMIVRGVTIDRLIPTRYNGRGLRANQYAKKKA